MDARLKLLICGLALVVVSTALTVLLLTYHSDFLRGVRRLEAVRSEVFHSPLGEIEYRLEGDGPTLLVSHGITGGVDQAAGLASTYVGSGYRLLLVSRLGYLRSSLPKDASAALQARLYAELLAHLGIDRVWVFGNSAGGTSALRFAIDFPERCNGLILVSSNVPGAAPMLPPRPAIAAVFGSSFLYWSAVRLLGGAMLGMFVPKPILSELTPAARDDLERGILLAGLPIGRRTKGVLFDMYVSNPSIDQPTAFEAIACPVLLIHAEDDPSCPIGGARSLTSRIPGSRLETFAHGGHLLLGREQEIKQLIQGFAQEGSSQ